MVHRSVSHVDGGFWIEGPRVRLRPQRASDAARACQLQADPESRRFLNRRAPPDPDELDALFTEGEQLFARGAAYYFALEPAGGGAMLGSIGVRFPHHPLHANLGYSLGPEFWGQGLMTEAVALALRVAFEHCHVARADARVRVGNQASRRVLEHCGFQLDGTLRWNTQVDGRWYDEWVLTLPRPDWEARARQPDPVRCCGALPRAPAGIRAP